MKIHFGGGASPGFAIACSDDFSGDESACNCNDVLLSERFPFSSGTIKIYPGMLEICRKLKVSSEACLYLGDTDTDMKTAVSAGCYAVGVLWGFRSEKELKDSGAQAIIEKPMEALKLLKL